MVANKTPAAARQLSVLKSIVVVAMYNATHGQWSRNESKTYVISPLLISYLTLCSVHVICPVDDDKYVTTQDHYVHFKGS